MQDHAFTFSYFIIRKTLPNLTHLPADLQNSPAARAYCARIFTLGPGSGNGFKGSKGSDNQHSLTIVFLARLEFAYCFGAI